MSTDKTIIQDQNSPASIMLPSTPTPRSNSTHSEKKSKSKRQASSPIACQLTNSSPPPIPNTSSNPESNTTTNKPPIRCRLQIRSPTSKLIAPISITPLKQPQAQNPPLTSQPTVPLPSAASSSLTAVVTPTTAKAPPSNLDTIAAVACQVADSATHHLAKRPIPNATNKRKHASESDPQANKRIKIEPQALLAACEANKRALGNARASLNVKLHEEHLGAFREEVESLRLHVAQELGGMQKRLGKLESEVRELVRAMQPEGERASTPASSSEGEEYGRRGKRRRDNWTVNENADFLRLVRMNAGMEEMQLRRMLAKHFAPRRSHEQCANHLRILRAQKKVPPAVGEAVAYRVRGREE